MAVPPAASPQPPGAVAIPSSDEIARAAGYLALANNLLAQRFSYSLVAHSMALAAYATCVGNQVGDEPLAAIFLAFGGAAYCWVQWKITHPLSQKIDALRDAYLAHDPVYTVYQLAAGGRRARGLQSVAVPAGLAVLWLLLLVYAGTAFMNQPAGALTGRAASQVTPP